MRSNSPGALWVGESTKICKDRSNRSFCHFSLCSAGAGTAPTPRNPSGGRRKFRRNSHGKLCSGFSSESEGKVRVKEKSEWEKIRVKEKSELKKNQREGKFRGKGNSEGRSCCSQGHSQEKGQRHPWVSGRDEIRGSSSGSTCLTFSCAWHCRGVR